MLDSELNVNRFLVSYCRMLVGDIADERLAEQPLPGVNHPAWILGHLAFSADRACSLLDAPKELPATWTPLFGPGSKPSASIAVRLFSAAARRARNLSAASNNINPPPNNIQTQ